MERPETYTLTEDDWKKIFSLPMSNYLEDALKEIKKIIISSESFTPKKVHRVLRPQYRDKYKTLDSKYYPRSYEQVKGMNNIITGLNRVFKENAISFKINQYSLRMYSNSTEETRYHFVKVSTVTC
jgi:hypothetical protein